MSYLKKIVSVLNHEPYNFNISLVELDGKSFEESVEFLARVCNIIDPNANLSSETHQDLSSKVLEFVKLLNFKESKDP